MIKKYEMEYPLDDLPKICIYSMDDDFYSQFYDVSNTCTCGSTSWNNSILNINIFDNQLVMTPKRIQRCEKCKTIRTAKLKNVFEEIIKISSNTLKSFLKIEPTENIENKEMFIWFILKNMLMNLEILINHKNIDLKKKIEDKNLQDMQIELDLKNILYKEAVKKNDYKGIGLN